MDRRGLGITAPIFPELTQHQRKFTNITSWEQYRQVFDAIVQSNGWDDATAALQLLSHLEGDALNVAGAGIQVSIASGISGCIDCTIRLADYRRQFERTVQTTGEDPSIFATGLETLVIKALGTWVRQHGFTLSRDRFVAGHHSCELRRHLYSVSPMTSIQDIVDRCRVSESHADSDVRRMSKPGPDRTFPIYVVIDSERGTDDRMVAAVTTSQSTPDQLILLRRLLADPAVPAPPPKPEPPTVEQLLQRLLAGAQARRPPRP